MATASYSANETNPLTSIDVHNVVDHSRQYNLGDPKLAKITRLRLLSDAGFPWWDVSYCYGELHDGTPVSVWLGDGQLRKADLKRHLIELAKEAGVYAKGMGLLDDGVISKLS